MYIFTLYGTETIAASKRKYREVQNFGTNMLVVHSAKNFFNGE